jgi:hypothetical protein
MDPDDINLDGISIDWNAKQVRTSIRSYLNSGEMKGWRVPEGARLVPKRLRRLHEAVWP